MERFSKELRAFIDNTQWIFAKTYATTWPHSYIIKDKADAELFVKVVKHIRLVILTLGLFALCSGFQNPQDSAKSFVERTNFRFTA